MADVKSVAAPTAAATTAPTAAAEHFLITADEELGLVSAFDYTESNHFEAFIRLKSQLSDKLDRTLRLRCESESERGNIHATVNAGWCYFFGFGTGLGGWAQLKKVADVPKDKLLTAQVINRADREIAFQYWLKAHAAGNVTAQLNLLVCQYCAIADTPILTTPLPIVPASSSTAAAVVSTPSAAASGDAKSPPAPGSSITRVPEEPALPGFATVDPVVLELQRNATAAIKVFADAGREQAILRLAKTMNGTEKGQSTIEAIRLLEKLMKESTAMPATRFGSIASMFAAGAKKYPGYTRRPHPDAMYALATIYNETGTVHYLPGEALILLIRAAVRGHYRAQHKLGTEHQHGGWRSIHETGRAATEEELKTFSNQIGENLSALPSPSSIAPLLEIDPYRGTATLREQIAAAGSVNDATYERLRWYAAHGCISDLYATMAGVYQIGETPALSQFSETELSRAAHYWLVLAAAAGHYRPRLMLAVEISCGRSTSGAPISTAELKRYQTLCYQTMRAVADDGVADGEYALGDYFSCPVKFYFDVDAKPGSHPLHGAMTELESFDRAVVHMQKACDLGHDKAAMAMAVLQIRQKEARASHATAQRILETHRKRVAAAAVAAAGSTTGASDTKVNHPEWLIRPEHAVGMLNSYNTNGWNSDILSFSGASAFQELISSMMEDTCAIADDFKPPPAAMEEATTAAAAATGDTKHDVAAPTPIASSSGSTNNSSSTGMAAAGSDKPSATATASATSVDPKSKLLFGLTRNPADDVDRTQLMWDLCAAEHNAGNPVASNNLAVLFTISADRWAQRTAGVRHVFASAAEKGCAMATYNLAVMNLFGTAEPNEELGWKMLKSLADDEKLTAHVRGTAMIQVGWLLKDPKSAQIVKRVVDPATAADAKNVSQKYFDTASAGPYNSPFGLSLDRTQPLLSSKDITERLAGWEKITDAAAAGSVPALMFAIGVLTTGLRPVIEPDYAAARAMVRRLSRIKGRSAEVCKLLGDIAEAEKNAADAFRWYSLGGEKDNQARYKVAVYLSIGGFFNDWDVKKDKKEAKVPLPDPAASFKLYQSLTETTNAALPALQVASCYLHGHGAEMDHKRGFGVLLAHTLSGGEPNALVYREMAVCYMHGTGTKSDIPKALACLAKVRELLPGRLKGKKQNSDKMGGDALDESTLRQVTHAEVQLRAKAALQDVAKKQYELVLATREAAKAKYGADVKDAKSAAAVAAARGLGGTAAAAAAAAQAVNDGDVKAELKAPLTLDNPEAYGRAVAAAAVKAGKTYMQWSEDECAGLIASNAYKIDRPSAFHNMHNIATGSKERAAILSLMIEMDTERGSPIALANRGWMHWEDDKQTAIWYWEEAAKLGVVTARVNLLVCRIRELHDFYETYHYSTKTKTEYFAELKQLAEKTQNRTALINLALCHLDGAGCEADEGAFTKTLQALVAVEDPIAFCLYGVYLLDKDKAAGLALVVRASMQNCTVAIELVVAMKIAELQELRDEALAMAQAGEGGAGDALTLREMRAKGLAMKTEIQKMIDKWSEVDSKDSACVMWCQSRLLQAQDPPNPDEAIQLQMKCAQLGHPDAMTTVGVLMIQDAPNNADPAAMYAAGLDWLERAWAAGSDSAGLELASALLQTGNQLMNDDGGDGGGDGGGGEPGVDGADDGEGDVPPAAPANEPDGRARGGGGGGGGRGGRGGRGGGAGGRARGGALSAEALAAVAERKAEGTRILTRVMDEILNPLIEKGNGDAMFTMAMCLWSGVGVGLDWEAAVAMMERAIATGIQSPEAPEMLERARAALAEQREAVDQAAGADPAFARPGAGDGAGAAGAGARRVAGRAAAVRGRRGGRGAVVGDGRGGRNAARAAAAGAADGLAPVDDRAPRGGDAAAANAAGEDRDGGGGDPEAAAPAPAGRRRRDPRA